MQVQVKARRCLIRRIGASRNRARVRIVFANSASHIQALRKRKAYVYLAPLDQVAQCFLQSMIGLKRLSHSPDKLDFPASSVVLETRIHKSLWLAVSHYSQLYCYPFRVIHIPVFRINASTEHRISTVGIQFHDFELPSHIIQSIITLHSRV